jgi:hypothetical protein
MPKRKYRRKKTGLELLAAVLVAIGAVLCIVIGLMSIFSIPNVEQYMLRWIFPQQYVAEVVAIVIGVIIIAIEAFNKLNDYWSIIGVFILAIIAATIGALVIIIGALLAIIGKVMKE